MLGIKLRSWMEAVRPRKKQQRKEKQSKTNFGSSNTATFPNSQSVNSTRSSENDIEDMTRKSILVTEDKVPRYSGANLSSPESAYSTGYSTDGTSPGAPPEYFINIRSGNRYTTSAALENKNYGSPTNRATIKFKDKLQDAPNTPKTYLNTRDEIETSDVNSDFTPILTSCDYSNYKNNTVAHNVPLSNRSTSSTNANNNSVMSPRQRNRIRTNPWVPANNISPGNSCIGLSYRQDSTKSPVARSPASRRYYASKTPLNHKISKSRQSLSSSSCSSLSTTASTNWDLSLARQSSKLNIESDDEDCTLNEMMGKYDESYVYEKETDILSDSDATDCETDIDTGQGSNGEQDPAQCEFDFIDNGSYLEFSIDSKTAKNTGHCTYHNYELQKKTSRRRTARRSIKQEAQYYPSKQSERRRRASSSKKKVKTVNPPVSYSQNSGSRSAGATPLSARRTRQTVSKLVTDDNLRRRSNSVTFNSHSVHIINQKDKEADKKYRELIHEADRLLTSMKSNVLSPRRIPVPPNKRVELLRNAESSKADVFVKNRLIDDTINLHVSKIPSSNFNSPRFSPIKNHITNFISNNSPVQIRKDLPPGVGSKKELRFSSVSGANSGLDRSESFHPQTDVMTRKSSRYRKRASKSTLQRRHNPDTSGSSDSDDNRINLEYGCPHSEPLKRKVYNGIQNTTALNLNIDSTRNADSLNKSSSSLLPKINTSFRIATNSSCGMGSNGNTENLRQQVLLNTIANLKRNLESQSASLRRVYKSSNNIPM
ncbi:hypothetical protein FQR65_LT14820 [Abscondita terminalis]|nr:hypothetical protein FQR65_LT14820 [Abscondita terminalis]